MGTLIADLALWLHSPVIAGFSSGHMNRGAPMNSSGCQKIPCPWPFAARGHSRLTLRPKSERSSGNKQDLESVLPHEPLGWSSADLAWRSPLTMANNSLLDEQRGWRNVVSESCGGPRHIRFHS